MRAAQTCDPGASRGARVPRNSVTDLVPRHCRQPLSGWQAGISGESLRTARMEVFL